MILFRRGPDYFDDLVPYIGFDNLVPQMHIIEDRTTEKDSLHLSQLITTALFPGEHVC